MTEFMAFIYKITNDINDKVYVGKTEFSLEKRFAEHCRDAFKTRNEKRPLYNAIKKYGVEHFQITLLEETDFPEEREIHWINIFDSYVNGYNATTGGDGKKYINYDDVVQAYKEFKNCVKVADSLGIHVDSVRNILRAKGVDIISSTDVARSYCSKPVVMFLKTGEQENSFVSIIDAARFIVQNSSVKSDVGSVVKHIVEVCKGKRKSAYGFVWEYKNAASVY